MSETIERVAKAIYEAARFKATDDHVLARFGHGTALALARAAIAAMREPTEAMVKAAHVGEAPREPNSFTEMWKQTIDDILNEKDPSHPG